MFDHVNVSLRQTTLSFFSVLVVIFHCAAAATATAAQSPSTSLFPVTDVMLTNGLRILTFARLGLW